MPGPEDLFEKVLKKSVDKHRFQTIETGTVKEVNGNTCTVERTDAPTLFDVRLQAIEDSVESFINIKPKVGSIVICGMIENMQAEYLVLQCSEIDEVNITIAGVVYTINSEGHLIKKGDDTLKQILTDLIDSVKIIVVTIGNNPNYVKLAETQIKINNLLL